MSDTSFLLIVLTVLASYWMYCENTYAVHAVLSSVWKWLKSLFA